MDYPICGHCKEPVKADQYDLPEVHERYHASGGCIGVVAQPMPSITLQTCKRCGFILRDCQCPTNETNDVLQLLIIDLGDVCVVKQECGRLTDLPLGENTYSFIEGNVHMWHHPFADVRAALDAFVDGQSPVPRIEYNINGGYSLFLSRHRLEIDSTELSDLCGIWGKPLPVYEPTKGEWSRVPPTNEAICNPFPFDAWRYTLKAA